MVSINFVPINYDLKVNIADPTMSIAPLARLSPLAMVFFSSGNQWDGETLS